MEAAAVAKTFRDAAEKYICNRTGWVDGHSLRIEHRLNRDIYPKIGNIPIADVTATDVSGIVQAMGNRDAKKTARRVAQTTNQIVVYSISLGLRADGLPAGLSGAVQGDRRPTKHRKAPSSDRD